MKKGTSLYLDVVRFSAALMVFAEHIREHTKHSFSSFWGAHWFWYTHSNPYSQTAVTVFFALSGYVIAHVLSTRESNAVAYTASRIARLYSVVIPALILTLVCNYFITLRFPTAFQSFDALGRPFMLFTYLGTAIFINCFWLWPELITPNTAFWSLSYEASYYAGIGLFTFTRGWTRIISLLLLALIAGPSIVLLSPAWLVGYGAYHVSKRHSLGFWLASVTWFASLALLLLCPFIELKFRQPMPFLRMPDHHLGELLSAYAASFCFAVHVFATASLNGLFEKLLSWCAGAVRWVGSLTFALYLFHSPLISFFTVYSMPDRRSLAQVALLIGGPLFVVATLGRLCEQSKGVYKDWILHFWNRAFARPLVSQ